MCSNHQVSRSLPHSTPPVTPTRSLTYPLGYVGVKRCALTDPIFGLLPVCRQLSEVGDCCRLFASAFGGGRLAVVLVSPKEAGSCVLFACVHPLANYTPSLLTTPLSHANSLPLFVVHLVNIVIRVSNLTSGTDIEALAGKLMEHCKLITPARQQDLVSVLTFLLKRSRVSLARVFPFGLMRAAV
jgi:hypothetical protein